MFLALTYGFSFYPNIVVLLVIALLSQCSAIFDTAFIYAFSLLEIDPRASRTLDKYSIIQSPTKAMCTQNPFSFWLLFYKSCKQDFSS